MIFGTRNVESILNQPIPQPDSAKNEICVEGFWIAKGPLEANLSEKVGKMRGKEFF